MESLLESKITAIMKLKNYLNHSIHMSDTDLRKMITKSIRMEKDIVSEDKQEAIEYFYSLLRKPR